MKQEPLHKRFMNHKLSSIVIMVAVLAVATCIALWQKPSVDTEYISPVDKSYVYRNDDFNFKLVLSSAWEGYKVEQNQDNQIFFLVPLSSESGVSGKQNPWYAPFYLWFHTPKEWQDLVKAGVQGQKELLANNSEYYVSVTKNNPPQELAGVDFGVSSVLSSFKFTDSEDLVADWKIYSNSEYGFEIKHPSDWTVSDEKDLSNQLAIQFVSPGFGSDNFKVFIISFGERGQYFGEKIVLPNGMAAIKMDGRNDRGVSEQSIILDYPIVGHPKSGYVYIFNYQVHEKDNLETYSTPASFTESEEALRAKILSTLKFIEREEVTAGWETYSNASLGFSIKYPSNVRPTSESDDEYNRLTSFGSSFEVRLEDDSFPDIGVIYGFLGSEVVSQEIKLGGITGYSAISETGYGDAGAQGRPYIEFGARHNGEVYHLIFYGDAILSAEESQVLSTFKFTN